MDQSKYKKGIEARREVLGDKNVKQFLDNMDDFNRPFRELAIQYCWGEIWGNEGLPKKTRSLINIALLTALNSPSELKVHLSGALNNGCTKEEIQEVLMQCAIYCGIPAASASFGVATDFFKNEYKN